MDIEKSIIKHIMTKDGGDYSKLNMIPSTIQDVKTALTLIRLIQYGFIMLGTVLL